MTPSTSKLAASPLRHEPKHLSLVRAIKEQIQTGQLRPGDQLPSFQELRARWGVGRDTLERMYRMLEQERLIVREHRRGIFIAKPEESRKTGTVGFIIHSSLRNHLYYTHLLEGVQRDAARDGVGVLLLNERTTINWEKIDGIIYQATVRDFLSTLRVPIGMPHVSLIYQQPDIDSVIADDYPGMMQVMEHLLSLGHRRIGFLTLEVQPHAMSRRRLQAYHDALQSNGIKPEGSWVRCLHEPLKSGRSWEEMGYGDMRQWLDEDWNKLGCTALLAHNDETAVGVISALHDAGHRVPEDISVVGFDGTEIAHFHRPQLTTVEVPLAEIGARGHGLLTQQINRPLNDIVEQRPPALLTLPTQFRPGQSTGPCKQ